MPNTHTTEKQGLNSSFEIGDILYSSWGYEQTNVNFYQVTKKVGLKMVELREIHNKSTDIGGYHSMVQHVVPDTDNFKEGKNYPVLRRKVLNQGCVRITDGQYAYLNDKPFHFTSSYA